MRSFFLAGVAALLGCAAANGQTGRAHTYIAPLAGTVTLSEVEDKYNAGVISLEAPNVDGNADKKRLAEAKAEIEKRYPRKQASIRKKTTATAPMPVLGINFVADSNSGIPPDNYSALSKGYKAVSVMNDYITVHDANTGAYLTRKGLKSFSSAVGLNSLFNDYRFDPKVMYDPEADKFICVMLNSTNQFNWIVVGFSQTNDPSGAWNFYKFYGNYNNDTTWFDYPAISMTKTEFFLTGNQIRYSTSWQEGFRQTVIYQIKKEDGYTGAPITYRIWDSIRYNDRPLRCLHPLKPADEIPTAPQYFLSNRNFDVLNDTVFLVKVPDVIGAPDSTLTITPLVSSLSYGVPPNGRQPDTSVTLATNDGRVLGGYKRGDEIQFVSTSVNPLNGASAIYHGTISNVSTSPSLTARLYGSDTLDFGYPNISYANNVSGKNQSIISVEYTGPNTNPGYGAIFHDGTDYSDLLTIRKGDSSIKMLTGKEQRWGDYSGSQPDWNHMGVVWVEGIFGRKDRRYGNYMAQIKSPYFTDVAPTSTQHTMPKLYPVPAVQFVRLEFEVKQPQGFSFMLYNTAGSLVDKVLDQNCKSGRNIIQFNTALLPPGTYFVKAVGEKGEQVQTGSFIRQ